MKGANSIMNRLRGICHAYIYIRIFYHFSQQIHFPFSMQKTGLEVLRLLENAASLVFAMIVKTNHKQYDFH